MKRCPQSVLATLAFAFGAAACTPVEVEPEDPACLQEESQAAPPGEDDGTGTRVAWLGAVVITERKDATAGNTPTGSVAASFYDVTNFMSQSPAPITFTPTCVGITGQPAQTGTRQLLGVSAVTVNGLLPGTLTLGGADGGLSRTGLPALYGDAPLDVDIAGADGGFVSVDFPPVAAPQALDVNSPALDGTYAAGAEDVVVRWNGRGEGVVTIDLSVLRDGQRAALSCVVKDDGCHRVGSGLMTWLAAGQPDPITVVVKRALAQSVLVDNGVDGGAGAIMLLNAEARGRINP